MEIKEQNDNTPELAQRGYWPAAAFQHFEQKKYSKAVDLCRRMLEKEPLLSGRVILARAMFHAGEYRQAREEFARVLKVDASHLVALKYLGDIHFLEGEEAAAMAYYRRVQEIDPCGRGLACPIDRVEPTYTRQLALKRPAEMPVKKDREPLSEPAFVTETVGDIYRNQGYFRLAEIVYRRLLDGGGNNRIADKLRDMEDKIAKKEKQHENPH